ncbi:tripartite ATP-independent transporter DctM subunit [Sinorhizobium kostiense]|uniref:Tripartite ATP-independent transporter DctM subunit n=2 Tax=Sinorhizobium kostiense TaxID=76747 RepID=A0ABS4QSK0_9HYPH|nr:tripartite ATP-independent transporter DctM subunit [Sinorhizobium kostiense]
MQNTMKSVARLMGNLSQGALWIAGIGLVLMTMFIAAQVIWRYVFNDSLTWSEPASVMIMGWFIFLGAAVGIREGYHLSFDVLLYLLPQRGKELLHTLSDVFVGAFGGGMIFYGAQLAIKTAGNQMPSLAFPAPSTSYPSWPAACWSSSFLSSALPVAPPASIPRVSARRSRSTDLMELWILFGTFTFLLLIGTPVAFCLGVSSFATILYLGLPPVVIFQRLNSGVSVFALMAIPFFIFAGDLMVRGDIARRLVALAGSMVGHLRGGLGQVNILASVMFGGVSGSAAADASAVGGLMVPQMKARGYDVDYAVNITVVGSIIALMIPPSHNMIIYSISAGGRISIADLFTAGIIPGLLLALCLMLAAWIVARQRGYPTEAFPGLRAMGRLFVSAVPGLILIAIIFGGVRSGVFTASESSNIAVVYALLVTLLVYRTLSWEDFKEATFAAVRTTAMVLMVIGCAASFGWLLAYLKVPTAMVSLLQGVSENPLIILLLLNVVLLILGTFMDMSPLIVITTPIFLPVATAFGVDPVHFGVILILNLGIGLCTPPVGAVLFVGCAVGRIPIWQALQTIWPFYGAAVAALLLVTYVPALSLWLPSLFR